jgi:hypothetical protein
VERTSSATGRQALLDHLEHLMEVGGVDAPRSAAATVRSSIGMLT